MHCQYLSVVCVFQEWEWNYGKSPKFSVTAEKSLNFGHLVRMTDLLDIDEPCSYDTDTEENMVIRLRPLCKI